MGDRSWCRIEHPDRAPPGEEREVETDVFSGAAAVRDGPRAHDLFRDPPAAVLRTQSNQGVATPTRPHTGTEQALPNTGRGATPGAAGHRNPGTGPESDGDGSQRHRLPPSAIADVAATRQMKTYSTDRHRRGARWKMPSASHQPAEEEPAYAGSLSAA